MEESQKFSLILNVRSDQTRLLVVLKNSLLDFTELGLWVSHSEVVILERSSKDSIFLCLLCSTLRDSCAASYMIFVLEVTVWK